MKQFILSTAITLSTLSCTDYQVADKKTELPTIDHPEQVEIRKSFEEIPIDNSAFCPTPASGNCTKSFQLMLAQLMVLDPIPVPQPGVGQTISTSNAIDRYRAFLTDYAGEPIISVFKQLYPKILLTKYGILDGSDYAQITYLTQQLIEARSYDSATLAAALKKLKHHLPPNQFMAMKTASIGAAERRKVLIEKEITSLSDTTATGPYSDKMSALVFPKEIRAHFLVKMKDDYAAVVNDLVALNRL
ncbi:hypothetical protein [Fibrivirga algicola]|uniref:DUF4375 domain-containing protein n=1 Tax=Fibrivirga algicola TaxID=2950420 RepID=A0ABX0QL65_9BACT|nr:hypothetical protein [Fibrivirga algicola]NID10874.1 hypothetical protein [Fibrivirga algicola]